MPDIELWIGGTLPEGQTLADLAEHIEGAFADSFVQWIADDTLHTYLVGCAAAGKPAKFTMENMELEDPDSARRLFDALADDKDLSALDLKMVIKMTQDGDDLAKLYIRKGGTEPRARMYFFWDHDLRMMELTVNASVMPQPSAYNTLNEPAAGQEMYRIHELWRSGALARAFTPAPLKGEVGKASDEDDEPEDEETTEPGSVLEALQLAEKAACEAVNDAQAELLKALHDLRKKIETEIRNRS